MVKVRAYWSKPEQISARVERRYTSVSKEMPRNILDYLQSVEKTAKNIVRREAYDTGNLHDSIEITPKTLGAIKTNYRASVGPNPNKAHYQEFVEFGHFAGHTWVPGVYYMTRAFQHNNARNAIFTANIRNAFRYYGEGGKHLKYPDDIPGLNVRNKKTGKINVSRVKRNRKAANNKLAKARRSKKRNRRKSR